MNYCPHCGKPLQLQTMKFCPECGCDLSDQPLKNDAFICPDCGMVFEDTIPSECPNCSCPSDQFKKHEEEQVPQYPSTQKKSSFRGVLITLLIIGVIGGLSYWIYNIAQQYAGETKQWQYAQEQHEKEREKEREQRAEEEQKRRIQEEDKKLFKKMIGTYVSNYFDLQGTYAKYRITLYGSGSYEIEILNEYHQVVHRRTGSWEACSASNVIVLDIDRSGNWGGVISIVGYHLSFGGVECY